MTGQTKPEGKSGTGVYKKQRQQLQYQMLPKYKFLQDENVCEEVSLHIVLHALS